MEFKEWWESKYQSFISSATSPIMVIAFREVAEASWNECLAECLDAITGKESRQRDRATQQASVADLTAGAQD